jgi:hypothetical protein
MIKISLDLTEATKAEFDTYMASRLREYVIEDLARDFRGCEVQIESAGGPHAVERFESSDVRDSSPVSSDAVGNQASKKLGRFPITERVDGILRLTFFGVGLLFVVAGILNDESDFNSSVCFWIATASFLSGAVFAIQNRNFSALSAASGALGCITSFFALIQSIRFFGS